MEIVEPVGMVTLDRQDIARAFTDRCRPRHNQVAEKCRIVTLPVGERLRRRGTRHATACLERGLRMGMIVLGRAQAHKVCETWAISKVNFHRFLPSRYDLNLRL